MGVFQTKSDEVQSFSLTDTEWDGSRRLSEAFTGAGIKLIGAGTISHEGLYRDQPWIRAAVNKLARAVAKLPWKAYELLDDAAGHSERDRSSSLADLARRPAEGMSPFRHWEGVVWNMCVHGEAFALKVRSAGGAPPRETVLLDWHRCIPYYRDGKLVFYRIRGRTKGDEFVQPEEIVRYRFFRGESPLQALAVTMSLEDAGQRYATASFANAARPSGLVSIDRKGLNRDDVTRIEEELRSKHQGPDNAFRVAVVGADAKWHAYSHTSQEAETIAHRKLNREEVCAVFDIPPPLLHILDRATFSNITEQNRMMYVETLGPWLNLLEDEHRLQVVDPEPVWAGRFCEFDLGEILRGTIDERATAYQKYLHGATRTPNDLRRLENLPPIDHPLADMIFVPRNLWPVGPGAPDFDGSDETGDVPVEE